VATAFKLQMIQMASDFLIQSHSPLVLLGLPPVFHYACVKRVLWPAPLSPTDDICDDCLEDKTIRIILSTVL